MPSSRAAHVLGPECLSRDWAVEAARPFARVAVIIAAKDASGTIGRAVRSALAEPEAAEVILVDDGSVDDTAEVARACDDGTGRLRVMRQVNRGPSAARNAAIDSSNSPYVCVLDADDFFTPGRLRRIFEAAGSDWDLVSDKLLLAEEGAEDGPYERWRADEALPRELNLAQFVDGNITRASRPRQELGYLKPLIRRAFLDAHRLRFREDIWLGEDYLLYTEILARGGRFMTVENYGYVAVQRLSSLSHQHPAEHLEALVRADEALAKIPGVPAAGRRALTRHRNSTRRRWTHRRVLEAKRSGEIRQAVVMALSGPGLLFHIVLETSRAWLERMP